MAMTQEVSSTTPTLLFDDTDVTGNFQFVLDNLEFRMEDVSAGGWILCYDQSDSAWHVRDSFQIQNGANPATLDLMVSTMYGWRVKLSGGTLHFEYIYGGTGPCVWIKTTGDIELPNFGGYQTEFFSHDCLRFKEASTSVDVMQFHFGGTKKAGISNAGRGTFPAVKCGGAGVAPTDTGRYLGELRLRYGNNFAWIWAWVETGASTEGWRGVELS
jgi:hypothetical protein